MKRAQLSVVIYAAVASVDKVPGITDISITDVARLSMAGKRERERGPLKVLTSE